MSQSTRKCACCQLNFPLDKQFFYKDSLIKCGGYSYYCKPCHKVKKRESNRKSKLMIKYGLPIDGYWSMVKEQGERCAICQNQKELHVDHDHKTGAIRSLICAPCNHGLGNFFDNIYLMKRAIEYLEKHETETIS